TALVRAATNHEKTRLLVDAGATVRVRTALGNTPLILAARRSGNSRTVQLLLDRPARPGSSRCACSAAVAAEEPAVQVPFQEAWTVPHPIRAATRQGLPAAVPAA